MAVDSISISKPLAPAATLNYEQLFQEGIQHIEKLSGKIWTDYNAHDPGITILEVLSYAITELGYRSDFEIGDIIEPSPESAILNDFFSLANVGSNAPLTIDDFRKLLIDIDGNRNAWLEKVVYPAYDNTNPDGPDPNSKLFYEVTGPDSAVIHNSDTAPNKQISIKGLYDVYLQFEAHPEFGDLNDNSLRTILSVQPILQPLRDFEVEFEFPEWENIPVEEADALWAILPDNPNGVAGALPHFEVNNPTLTFIPDEDFAYQFDLEVTFDDGSPQLLKLPLTMRLITGQDFIINQADFRQNLEDELSNLEYSAGSPHAFVQLIIDFLARRSAITELLSATEASLANHRNLCEDFRAVYPMSLQEIGLDVDLDIAAGADCENIMAQVYYATEQYLSPVIRFYSLREMLEKGYSAEEIFRGPWLLNGFIDENDLSFYQRREILYTSDLLQEIMKIEGVNAVNHIAFSRYEFGKLAEKDSIIQKNMTECLCLKNPSRYLPRLNYNRSNILMNCGAGKPSQPSLSAALELLSELKAIEELKGKADQGDFALPTGTYSELGEYHSIQNDFPLNYGIGIEGLNSQEPALRHAQANQMKGYMLFFEQLLGNFLSQIENVRKLFSYSSDIDRTYFTQALYEVPRVKSLIRDFTTNHGPTFDFDNYQTLSNPADSHYAVKLDALAESNETFQDRRKRFLDHLVGRFNESFSEYAAYVFSRNITKAEKHNILIEDQAKFLRNYVMHSHDRGTGFNYQKASSDTPAIGVEYWRAGYDIESLNTKSGEDEPLPVENPAFVDPLEEFDIYQDASGKYRFRLYNANGVNMFYSPSGYVDLDDLKTDLNAAIVLGQTSAPFSIVGSTADLPGTTTGLFAIYGKVGAAFINSYGGDALLAVEELATYLTQLLTIDELPQENVEGHSVWQGANDVTGIKKRMVFLTGLPNVNRQYINPFEKLTITGSAGSYGFDLLDELDVVIYQAAQTFTTEDDVRNAFLELFENIASYNFDDLTTYFEIEDPSGPTVLGQITAAYVSQFPVHSDQVEPSFIAYLGKLFSVENLHVVEHVLLRQRQYGDPTLDARHDEKCAALDIEDPYSFRISVVLPTWAGRFKEQTFRTMFKRLMRAEVPAHVYIHFQWVDPLQMYHFEHCWADWLSGGWENNWPLSISGDGTNDTSGAFVHCFNALKNLRDAHYVVEPARIKDDYEVCDIIAAPYDPDGLIIKAWLSPGSTLPPGTCMDECSGIIRVTDVELLKAAGDEFDLQINTINAGGEETCHNIQIVFESNGNATIEFKIADSNQCYYVQQGSGLSILRFTDPETIVLAELQQFSLLPPGGGPLMIDSSGNPPAGMAFNTITGEVTTTTPGDILAGTYTFKVKLTDNATAVTFQTVSIVVFPNNPAVAAVNPPINEDAYATNDVLATITDPDGNLLNVTELGTSLASLGLALDPVMPASAPSVDIIIANLATFQAQLSISYTLNSGYYEKTLNLGTTDDCGGTNTLDVLIRVRKDNEAIFFPVPVKNVTLHNVGSLVGTIRDIPDDGLVAYNMPAVAAILTPLGLELTFTTTDPPAGLIKVINKTAFSAAINGAPTGAGNVGTINFNLIVKDDTGGITDLPCTVSATQDLVPIITVEAARNVDTYAKHELMATIADADGNGIASASHAESGFSLSSIGLRLVMENGYSGNNGAGGGESYLGGGEYQTLPEAEYYQPTIPGVAKILVNNIYLLRNAVNYGSAFTVVDSNTNRIRFTVNIHTTDSQGGFAINQVEIEILQDVEATMHDVMNGSRINTLYNDAVLVRFQDPDGNTNFVAGGTFVGLPTGLDHRLVGGSYEIYVSNKLALLAYSIPVSVNLTDNQGGQTSFSPTITILPKLVELAFQVTASQQGHTLDVSTKEPDLTLTSFTGAKLPKTFGTLYLANGKQIGFSEGSSFATSTYPMTMAFTGQFSENNEVVDGLLTVSRKNTKVDDHSEVKGLDFLGGNAFVNSSTTKSNTRFSGLANETGKMMKTIQDASYYADNPQLRTNPEVLAAYAAGTHDAEFSAAMRSLAEETTQEIAAQQGNAKSSEGSDKVTAQRGVEVLTETLKLQIITAVQYAGNVRIQDMAEGTPLDDLFKSYQSQLQGIFDLQSPSGAFSQMKALRNSLYDLQELYVDEKPVLNAAIAGLLGKTYTAQLSALEAKLASPHSGEVNAELATLIANFRASFPALDTLFADPEFRASWESGNEFQVIGSHISVGMELLIAFLTKTDAELKGTSYGIKQLDLGYAYDCASELLTIVTQNMFEMFDKLNGPYEIGSPNYYAMQGMGDFLKPLAGLSGLADYRSLVADWIATWQLRPSYVSAFSTQFEVAELEMASPRPITGYRDGDTIAAVKMLAGTLATVGISKGRLPRGMELDGLGKIIVSDVTQLMPGIYGGVVISGANDSGFSFSFDVPDIEFGEDSPATYVVNGSMAIELYVEQQVLAYPQEGDGELVETQIQSGNFPPGVRLNTESGEFSVAKVAKLVEGAYPMSVLTVDEFGGETSHDIVIQIGLGGSTIIGGELSLLGMQLPISDGTSLGLLPTSGFLILDTSITAGSMPAGVSISHDGKFAVANSGLLQAGTTVFTVLAQADDGNAYQTVVTMEFINGSGGGIQVTIQSLGNDTTQSVGNIITSLSYQGEQFTFFENVNGSFPPGLDVAGNGDIVVATPSAIAAGTYTFTIEGYTLSGLHYSFQVTIEFASAIPTVYIESTGNSLVQTLGTVLATLEYQTEVFDSFGSVTGNLPAGVEISMNGEVVIDDPDVLAAGTYVFYVPGTTDNEDEYNFQVTVEFVAASSVPNIVIDSYGNPTAQSIGNVIAVLSSPGIVFDLFGTVTGNLPPGVELTPSGSLVVSDDEAIVAGVYQFSVQAFDDNEVEYLFQVTIEFVAAAQANTTVNFGQHELPIADGTLLGEISNSNDPVVSVLLLQGDFPLGTTFQMNGEYIVSKTSDLTPGAYSFVVSVGLTSGAKSPYQVTIEFT